MKLRTGVARAVGMLLFAVAFTNAAEAQKKIDSSYNNTYYQGRRELFASLGGQKKAVVFLGNSITERGWWNELLPGTTVMNRGIGGDNTFGVLARLDEIILYRPKKIFLLIGINDLGRSLPVEVIAANYRRILQRLKEGSPETKIYAQSVLPLNEKLLTAPYLKGKGDSVAKLNAVIKEIATGLQIEYINLHPVFADENGELKEAFTMDGIHLKPVAYVAWTKFLKSKKYL